MSAQTVSRRDVHFCSVFIEDCFDCFVFEVFVTCVLCEQCVIYSCVFSVRMCIVHSLSSGFEIGEEGAAAFAEALEKNTTLQSLKFCECFHFRVFFAVLLL